MNEQMMKMYFEGYLNIMYAARVLGGKAGALV